MCMLNIPACTHISLYPYYHQSFHEIFQQIYLRIFWLGIDLYFWRKERNQNEKCRSLKEYPSKTHPCLSEILTARTICLSCQEHKQRKKRTFNIFHSPFLLAKLLCLSSSGIQHRQLRPVGRKASPFSLLFCGGEDSAAEENTYRSLGFCAAAYRNFMQKCLCIPHCSWLSSATPWAVLQLHWQIMNLKKHFNTTEMRLKDLRISSARHHSILTSCKKPNNIGHLLLILT